MKPSQLRSYIKDYPNFPAKGVVFRDISPLLAEPKAFQAAIDEMTKIAKEFKFDKIAAIDARGFIFASALALKLNRGMVMFRKAGKLPGEVLSETYGYEYAFDNLAVQKAAIKPDERLLIVDDVLATGKTLLAASNLIKKLQGEVVGILCFLELSYLDGRIMLEKNSEVEVRAVLKLRV